jgi:hypothetical protein
VERRTAPAADVNFPALRSLGELADRETVIVIDTREVQPLVFERLPSVRGNLSTGDYSVARPGRSSRSGGDRYAAGG